GKCVPGEGAGPTYIAAGGHYGKGIARFSASRRIQPVDNHGGQCILVIIMVVIGAGYGLLGGERGEVAPDPRPGRAAPPAAETA
ncbi:MAG: hypothetical protein ACC648_00100, partial [Thiohalobacterales bacterium]